MSTVLPLMHFEPRVFSDVYATVKVAVAVLFSSGRSGMLVSIPREAL
jgi:hypothetical protein